VNPQDFELISDLLAKRSGLAIASDKTYLLESRLTPVARQHDLNGLDGVIGALRGSPSEELLVDITDAMTTNETFFFRDQKPFDLFRNIVLPQIMQARSETKKFRIWCAAASTGQEPCTLAMILKEEAAKLADWSYDIVGTDLSRSVLVQAREGKYSQFEVQRGLPIQMLVKYFTQDKEHWKVNSDILDMIDYRELNLLDEFSQLGKFDIVFCRNVLIYFSTADKCSILERVNALMPDDGVMFLGGAETVIGITDKFVPESGQRGLYRPSGS